MNGQGSLTAIVALLLLLFVSKNHLDAVTFSAGLDRSTIQLGESAVLTLRFDGGKPDKLPTIPAVEHLEIGYAGQEQNITFNNGQKSEVLIVRFTLKPLEAKQYTIPKFTAEVGGAHLPTSPMSLNVLPRKEVTPPNDPLAQFTFVRVHTPSREVYVGQSFPLEVQLFFLNGQDIQLPTISADGFTLGKLSHRTTRSQANNRIYNVVVFQTIARPVKAGKLTIGPVQCPFTLRIPKQRKDFFGFQSFGLSRVAPTSEPYEMNVLPLPTANVPTGFSGALGTYDMAVTATPTNLAVGDPITLRVQIAGTGALANVNLPSLDSWKDFKVYPPTSSSEVGDEMKMQGVKTFEQVVVPQKPDIPELPEVTFSFFDPQSKEYRTLREGPFPLVVRPSAGGSQQPVFMVAQTNGAAGDHQRMPELIHIKPNLGIVQPIGAGLHPHAAVWSVPAISFLAWMALFVRRKRSEALANNPRLRRRLEVERTVFEGLQALRKQATEEHVADFFANLFRLLQERLGERMDVPAAAITEEVVDARLRPAGVAEELLQKVHATFQVCNEARYAPDMKASELSRHADEFEKLLRELKEVEGQS